MRAIAKAVGRANVTANCIALSTSIRRVAALISDESVAGMMKSYVIAGSANQMTPPT